MKPLIVANWKCNPTTLPEASRLFNSLKKGLKNIKKADIVICPPFVYLSLINNQIINNRLSFIKLGAQNCFWEEKGAFSGEISPLMLKGLGVRYVILGHSERRQIVKETDEMVNQKLKQALKTGLRPIICLGETKKQKEGGETFKVLERQIREGFKKISKKQIQKVIIAYEPIWAIGSGKPCDVQEAEACILFIRKIIAKLFSKRVATTLPVLYGGSVNSKNAPNYLQSLHINGLLVGSASLNPEEFLKIINPEIRRSRSFSQKIEK